MNSLPISIKQQIQADILKHQKMIQTMTNELIHNIYDSLVDIEEKTKKYERINYHNLDFVKNNNLYNTLFISHLNYFDLTQKHTNLENCNNINIKDIFSLIPKNNVNAKVPPFVILKIDKIQLSTCNDDMDEIEKIYVNIGVNFTLTDKYNIQLTKFKDKQFITVIIFFDSLTYNDEYIFNKHDIIDLTHPKYVNNIVINHTNTIINSNLINSEQIKIIKSKYQLQQDNIYSKVCDIDNIIKDILSCIEPKYESIIEEMKTVIETTMETKFKKYNKKNCFF